MPLLEAAIQNCQTFRTRRINDPSRFPEFQNLLNERPPFVLYPSDNAIPCEDLPKNALIIAIDGTWRQARGIRHNHGSKIYIYNLYII